MASWKFAFLGTSKLQCNPLISDTDKAQFGLVRLPNNLHGGSALCFVYCMFRRLIAALVQSWICGTYFDHLSCQPKLDLRGTKPPRRDRSRSKIAQFPFDKTAKLTGGHALHVHGKVQSEPVAFNQQSFPPSWRAKRSGSPRTVADRAIPSILNFLYNRIPRPICSISSSLSVL